MNASLRDSVTYILPIKSATAHCAEELAAYLDRLHVGQVIVVDASEPAVFAAHARAFSPNIEHIGVDSDIAGCNGKVRGVLTALRRARHERIVIGDDDVRYDDRSLDEVVAALADAEIVRPQNYFAPVPWHAHLDGARQLINRAIDGDWPGTLAFRREYLPHGYNADALFENLELVRTVRARGGREAVLYGTYVRRLPPTTEHFFTQRVRQAYDEFARPVRLAAALSILPLIAYGCMTRRPWIPAALSGTALLLAARGYVRAGGYRYFSPLAVLSAPLWMIERGACAWAALYERLRYGGVRYAGSVVRDAVSTQGELRRRWAA